MQICELLVDVSVKLSLRNFSSVLCLQASLVLLCPVLKLSWQLVYKEKSFKLWITWWFNAFAKDSVWEPLAIVGEIRAAKKWTHFEDSVW